MDTSPVRTIHAGGRLIAIIIYADYRSEGIRFFTPDELSQQLAYMNRKAGHRIDPHVHNPVKREVANTQEVLLVRRGRLRVDLFDDDRNYLESAVLQTGDVLLLASGGHGFEMLEDTEMIEVKQGPYLGEMDKTRFDPVSPDDIRINGGGRDG